MRRNLKNNIKSRKNRLLAGLFFLLFVCTTTYGIIQSPIKPAGENPVKKPNQIHIEHTDTLVFRENFNPDIHILLGNVIFRHDSTFMYCDSAYLYESKNSLEAFSNVRIEQGDTLFTYGDYLYYDGNSSLAKLRHNVRMISEDVTLFTDSFNYDRIKNIGYFFDGGMIVDSTNELTSIYGQYSPDTRQAFFKKDVTLKNPKFTLKSDTLKYQTDTKIATILGYSVIESDSGTIYSSRGWYNTTNDKSMLYDRSTVVSSDKNKTITADSIFYDKAIGFGEAFGNMVLNDTARKVILMGDYGYFNDKTNYAFATDSAQFIEYSMQDSLYLHADSLMMQSVGTNQREIKAYYGVRFYRVDIQGVCDSLQFNTQDSTLYLYKDPILWNTGYQMTGDTIQLLFNDSTIERTHIYNYAFALEKVDTTYYNQLKGRDLKAFFVGGELNKVDISGNAETIYYPAEKDGAFIGMNKTESSYFSIIVKNRKPHRMVWWPESSKGTLTPIPDLNPDTKFLKDFVDFEYLRPTDKESIFIQTKRKEADVPAPRKKRHLN